MTERMQQTTYTLQVPAQYLHSNAGPHKPLLICIHGFADSASSFVRRALPEPDPYFEILAPNGPFPQPKRVGDEWKEAYAWYFADLSRNKIAIHPSVAAKAIASLVDGLGLKERPKILCGFSQGGYFLPHLAKELLQVECMILVSAGCHPEFFASPLPVFAIHGEKDDVIAFAEAKADYERLGSKNKNGRFIAIPGMDHTMNDAGRAALKQILEETKT